jgi:predicted small lipoprotein YifL
MISRADALAILRTFPATAVAACAFPPVSLWCPIMRRPLLLLPLCLAAALLAGCGNKGPLYLPNNPHPPVHVPPQPVPAQSAPAPASSSAAPAATH